MSPAGAWPRYAAVAASLLLSGVAPNDPLPGLLDALKAAPDAPSAAALEAKIETLWLAAATPAVQVLVRRAAAEAQGGGAAAALGDMDAVLTLQPEIADLWRLRAEARFAAGDLNGAMADLAQALSREPRCFPALSDLSRVAEARHDSAAALAAWEKLLEIDPRAPGAAERLAKLQGQKL